MQFICKIPSVFTTKYIIIFSSLEFLNLKKQNKATLNVLFSSKKLHFNSFISQFYIKK